MLVRDLPGKAATISRLAIGPFVLFYSAWETVIGLATGVLVQHANDSPASPAPRHLDSIQALGDNAIVGESGALALAGGLAWIIAVIAGRGCGPPRRRARPGSGPARAVADRDLAPAAHRTHRPCLLRRCRPADLPRPARQRSEDGPGPVAQTALHSAGVSPRGPRLARRDSTHSSNVGPASVASGPGSRVPFARSSRSGSSGLLASTIRGKSPRRAASSVAASKRLSSRGPAISEIRAGSGSRGHVDERLGDGPGRDQLRAHLRHVAHIALGAPPHELTDELVELRRAEDADRDRARQHRLLVGDLCRLVAAW